MKLEGIRVALVSALLLGLGSTLAGAQEVWQPYDFSNTRWIELQVAVSEDEETRTGTTILEFEPKGEGQVTLHFQATLGEMSSEFTTTAPEDELYSQAMMQMMMNPAGAPLMATMFAPFWGMFFVGRDMSVGAGWSFSDGETSMSFKVESTCSYAGREGKQVIWRENDELRADACISPGVPLPLALTLNTEEGERFEIEMTKYESR